MGKTFEVIKSKKNNFLFQNKFGNVFSTGLMNQNMPITRSCVPKCQ